jgi:hypothetical protein
VSMVIDRAVAKITLDDVGNLELRPHGRVCDEFG